MTKKKCKMCGKDMDMMNDTTRKERADGKETAMSSGGSKVSRTRKYDTASNSFRALPSYVGGKTDASDTKKG
jgi:hypothetical protein